ncbi:predicted protein [Listeria monocytogenes J2818]|nr:predicted protein [Listeria monocytogenes J2818]
MIDTFQGFHLQAFSSQSVLALLFNCTILLHYFSRKQIHFTIICILGQALYIAI